MTVIIKQLNKELYSASFEIFQDNHIIGTIKLDGFPFTREANINVNILGKDFSIVKDNKIFSTDKHFRTHTVLGFEKQGNICQKYEKDGFFSSKVYYHGLNYSDKDYRMYPIGMGEYSVCPVYLNGTQVAELTKNFTVKNDLHEFVIYGNNEKDVISTIVIAAYMYLIAYYTPGSKPIDTVHKGFSKCTDKRTLAKFNPDFAKSLKENKNDKT